jgi:hypothetical protein
LRIRWNKNVSAGAECSRNGSFIPTVPDSVWVISNGMYRLVTCPPGHQLINSTDGSSSGTFSQDIQNCKACSPGQYIVDPNSDVCQNCPFGELYLELRVIKFTY